MTILLNPTNKTILKRVSKHHSQAILLSGPVGVGFSSAAAYIAHLQSATVIEVAPDITKSADTIGVETIRDLYAKLRVKFKSNTYVHIERADAMSTQAQNAFLKLLEEPNEAILFILSTPQPELLLPTIRSRVQQTRLHPLTEKQSIEYLRLVGEGDDVRIKQLLFMANGLPERLEALSKDSALFDVQVGHITQARKFLQGTNYSRLLVAHSYKDNRSGALAMLDYAVQQLQSSLCEANVDSITSSLGSLLTIKEKIKSNGNVRLQLATYVI